MSRDSIGRRQTVGGSANGKGEVTIVWPGSGSTTSGAQDIMDAETPANRPCSLPFSAGDAGDSSAVRTTELEVAPAVARGLGSCIGGVAMRRWPGGEGATKSILVVDDDEAMREALYSVLSPNYQVTLASDGLDGCEKASLQPELDLIIADVTMPGLDGISMVLRIRENETLRRVPVIFLSGQMLPVAQTAGMGVGTFGYLPKPTTSGVLELKVKRALAAA
jgi:CheY-like chemotaxis protein